MPNHCTKCEPKKPSKFATRSSLIGGLLVVIIPKCPLCVMAYSSAISMCGGDMYTQAGNNWLSYVPIGLAALIIGLIAYNRRGTRTWYALALAAVGAGMIVLSHQLILTPQFYNYGTILLFFSIWLNSNFRAVYAYIKERVAGKAATSSQPVID